METITVYVENKGAEGGAFPLTILSKDAGNYFSWLIVKVQESLPGFESKALFVKNFRTTSGEIIPWAAPISAYLETNSAANPIVVIGVEAIPVVAPLPVSVQENLVLIAKA
ncbi:MAG: hypothetical protein GY765_13315, partial [bacterium]|nr:hypothetical protein [bacterium]